jgi:glycosyltransferase involved in cell wall biosynthesis
MTAITVVSVSYPLAQVGPDAVGGAEQILTQLDRELYRSGHRSIVIAPSGSKVAGTHVVSGPVPRAFDSGTRAAATHRQAEILKRTLSGVRPDVIHLHSVDFSESVAACGEVPVLATLHLPIDHYPRTALEQVGGPRLQFVSQAQRRSAPPALRQNPFIPNGVDLEGFRPRRARRGFVLALGRICPEKRFDRALRAAARAKVPLLLGGRVFPYPEHQRHFHGEIVPWLGARARFLGPLTFLRKRLLLAAARCLIVPSAVPETSSLVTMEALASGTPVVAWRSGALPELIEHGRTGFLVDSEDELAAAIVESARLDGEVCRREAERRFSARRMAEQYLELYRQIAEGGTAANG